MLDDCSPIWDDLLLEEEEEEVRLSEEIQLRCKAQTTFANLTSASSQSSPESNKQVRDEEENKRTRARIESNEEDGREKEESERSSEGGLFWNFTSYFSLSFSSTSAYLIDR